MVITKPWVQLALLCMVFAMFIAVAMSDSSWPNSQASSVALEPTPPPNTGAGGDGGSAAAGFCPHLFTTTLLPSFAFLLPFYLSAFY